MKTNRITEKIKLLLGGSKNTELKDNTKLPFCLAPWSSMSFNLDGTVAVCCYSKKTTVSIAGKSIKEIWRGTAFSSLRSRMEKGDLEYDCSICLNQIKTGERSSVKARDYDAYSVSAPGAWPQVMEFCLENTCNLACEMCNSTLSSTIRKNNNLPPYLSKYDDQFLNELDEFIPHLKEAVFVGGEPFLIPSYFAIWEKMQRLNPNILISVVTNGTVLNNRVKEMLEKGRFRLNISIDSINQEVYEGIRNNAKLDTVLQNFEWFKKYATRKGTMLNIPICPLKTNWQTIPDTVRFAVGQGVYINFCYVDKPLSLSLIHATPKELEQILDSYSNEEIPGETYVAIENRKKFQNLIQDIYNWKEANLCEKGKEYSDVEEWICSFLEQRTLSDEKKFSVILNMIRELVGKQSEENRKYVVGIISEISPDRLYEICHNKGSEELEVILNDLLGNSLKVKSKNTQ